MGDFKDAGIAADDIKVVTSAKQEGEKGEGKEKFLHGSKGLRQQR